MENRLQQRKNNHTRLSERIDRATRDVNVFLVVIAVGLAVLDFTCYSAFKISETLPPSGYVNAVQPAAIAAVPAAARVPGATAKRIEPAAAHARRSP